MLRFNAVGMNETLPVGLWLEKNAQQTGRAGDGHYKRAGDRCQGV